MMRLIILIFIFTAACILRGKAQNDSIAVQLLSFEQKIFIAASESERSGLLLEKINYYLKAGLSGEQVLKDIKRVSPEEIQDSLHRQLFLWNAALVAHLNNDVNNAKHYFEKYIHTKKDTCISDALLGALIYDAIDTAVVRTFAFAAALQDTQLVCISCLNNAARYSKNGRGVIVLSSYFVPGSGSMMLGHVLKGAVSLLLVSSIGAGIYFLIADHLYINAAVFAAPWFFKFYGGQVKLTKKLFDEKEKKRKNRIAKRCAEQLDHVLKKYPVEFRW